MKRSEYITTKEGQSYERLKRTFNDLYIQVFQEPKSKNSITLNEKRDFRSKVFELLKQRKKRAFRSDIVCEIDFYTTQDNPPALQTLTKNYLDLLHKPMPEVDKYDKILFNDDNQIKILIANYHLNLYNRNKPEIRIRVYRYNYFIKDIELVDRILHNEFAYSDNSDIKFKELDYFDYLKKYDDYEYIDDLVDITTFQDNYINAFGTLAFNIEKQYLLRRIQEQFLQNNSLTISDLMWLFSDVLNYKKRYSNAEFQRLNTGINEKLIAFTTNIIELKGAPIQKGDTKLFKDNLENKLKDFKAKYSILFPLLQPINVTVFYTLPIKNLLDLDNLARYIIPLLISIFEPPSKMILPTLNEVFKNKIANKQRIPKYGLINYQLIRRDRKLSDPEEGIIKFYISDGLFSYNSIWNQIDRFIEKWHE
jgi:hypothetical protein